MTLSIRHACVTLAVCVCATCMNAHARDDMTEEEYMREARNRGLNKRERYWLKRYSYDERTEEKLDRAVRARGENHDEFKRAILNTPAAATQQPASTPPVITNSVPDTVFTNIMDRSRFKKMKAHEIEVVPPEPAKNAPRL